MCGCVAGQIIAGGPNDSLLLGAGHGVCAAAVCFISPKTDLGENQRIAIHHDQVDFTDPGLVIPGKGAQTTLPEERFCRQFPVAAALTGGWHLP